MTAPLPDPALIVLIGAAGAGKSAWANAHYAAHEIVSSDGLRAAVSNSPYDLDATDEAFTLLDTIVVARAGRRLTTVVDTLGLDADRRRRYVDLARRHGLAAVAVLVDTAEQECRRRNRERDRPVPARALAAQLKRMRGIRGELAPEGWDTVLEVRGEALSQPAATAPRQEPTRELEFVLQLSRFPWGDDPAGWLAATARATAEAGLAGLALMDHLIQIPQVGRDWEPIPQPWVALGLLAGLPTRLRLGTLVSPVTFHAPGVLAKALATLDALSGGRAFCGLGAGWWAREHATYALEFPPARQRLDGLATTIETLRALWRPGTKAYHGERVQLPETTCYPRPAHDIPIIVGGSGARTLRIAAESADGCNVPAAALDAALTMLRTYGRDPATFEVTVLDVPVLGRDRAHVSAIVDRCRGRTPAAAYAQRHHAGTADEHIARYRQLADRGVRTVFVALPDLSEPDDLTRLAPVAAAFA